jgi:hypothetical protein
MTDDEAVSEAAEEGAKERTVGEKAANNRKGTEGDARTPVYSLLGLKFFAWGNSKIPIISLTAKTVCGRTCRRCMGKLAKCTYGM